MRIRGARLIGCVIGVGALAACGDNKAPEDVPYFEWDAQHTLGAMSLDTLDASNDAPLLSKLDKAKRENWVVMVYGHRPSELASLVTIEAFMKHAQELDLPFYTFADLALDDGVAKPGICLSFDDTEVDDWMTLRPLFATYDARATFFVTRYDEFTDDNRQKLHVLYDEGNSIEAHGVHHVNANDYVAANGLDAYIADEVQPSIDILREDGFSPVAFAHPYGQHSPEIDAAISERVALVRSISQTPLPGHDCH
jgi:peptidoglycan/xylan/chitin deacetylase (PgdA/CDA1 family)